MQGHGQRHHQSQWKCQMICCKVLRLEEYQWSKHRVRLTVNLAQVSMFVLWIVKSVSDHSIANADCADVHSNSHFSVLCHACGRVLAQFNRLEEIIFII